MRVRAVVACIFGTLACAALSLRLPATGASVALAFIAAGALGICAEFLLPGGIVPGVAGSLLTLLGLAAISTYPIRPRGIALIVVALLLVVAEAKYVARANDAACLALTAAAALCMFSGTMTLIGGARIHPAVAIAVAFLLTPLISFLYYMAIRARLNKTLLAADRAVFRNDRESNVILSRAGIRPDQTTQSEAGQSQT